MRSSCHHRRECHQSIDQSINRSKRRLQVIQSINQSITSSWFLLIVLIKQWTYQSRDISSIPNQSINQSINQGTTILKWVFSLNGRGLQVLIAFCTVLYDEKSNGTMRCGRGCGGGGEPSPDDWVSVKGQMIDSLIHWFILIIFISFGSDFQHYCHFWWQGESKRGSSMIFRNIPLKGAVASPSHRLAL